MFDLPVVVIGGGAAGLACAWELKRLGVSKLIVLEASNELGGRTRSRRNAFGPRTPLVDLGAEFVHCDRTILSEAASKRGWKLDPVFTHAQGDGGPDEVCAPDGGAGYYWFEQALFRFDQLPKRASKVNEALWKLCELDAAATPSGVSVSDWLASYSLDESQIEFANAGFGNTHCCDLSELSLAHTIQLEKQWELDGEGSDYRLSDRGLGEAIIEWLSVENCEYILNARVVSVRDDGGVVECDDGRTFEAAAVVCAVPPTVTLKFDPPMTAERTELLKSLTLSPNVLKIFCCFESNSVEGIPKDFHGMICQTDEDCVRIPEIWETKRNDSGNFRVLVGFAAARYAERLVEEVGDDLLVDALCVQLQKVFKLDTKPTPLEGSFCLNYADVEDVMMGYTFPNLNQPTNLKSKLSENHGKVFFAGEHTDSEANMTAHSAIRTGRRAARQLFSLCLDSNVSVVFEERIERAYQLKSIADALLIKSATLVDAYSTAAFLYSHALDTHLNRDELQLALEFHPKFADDLRAAKLPILANLTKIGVDRKFSYAETDFSLEKFLEFAEKGLEIDSRHEKLRYRKALLLELSGNDDKAIETLKKMKHLPRKARLKLEELNSKVKHERRRADAAFKGAFAPAAAAAGAATTASPRAASRDFYYYLKAAFIFATAAVVATLVRLGRTTAIDDSAASASAVYPKA